MRNLIYAVTLVFLQAVPTECACYLGNCIPSECKGYQCDRCKEGFYLDRTSQSWRHFCKSCPATCSSCDGYEDCSGCLTSFYGLRCKSQCTACQNSTCERYTGACTNGCINGYYQKADNRCSQCPVKCSHCSSIDSCSQCKEANYWGKTCQYTCDYCSSCNRLNGCTSGCNIGSYQKYNSEKEGYECHLCSWKCVACTDINVCQTCSSTSYWGAACQHTCDYCSICNTSNGCVYNSCHNGYYRNYNSSKGGYECIQCPGTCTSCNAENSCQTCRTGYWGTVCQHACDNCASCSKSFGCKTSACNVGYFRTYSSSKGGHVCNECRGTCSSCTTYNNCQTCSRKYWGTKCLNSCPNSCIFCTSDTACSSCESGYWGNSCQHNCSACLYNMCSKSQGCTNGCIKGYYQVISGNEYHCEKCLATCETCSAKNSCSTCPSGFAGSLCQYDCRSCNGRLCSSTTGECTYVCNSDEYFEVDWPKKGCFKCPDNCSMCSSANSCTKCVNGYFGGLCLSKCLSACKSCSNGYSCESCLVGHFSKKNNQKCECSIENCSKQDENVCKECNDNTWYPESNGCCPCSANCKENKCSNDGLCIDCIDTKYGTNCELNCQSQCAKSLCYQNGSCISCRDNRIYGPTCSGRMYCWSVIPRCNRCYGLNRDTLTCTKCSNGWYAHGHTCTACSSHCVSTEYSKCDQSTGECNGYCKTGWFGERCDINCNVTDCHTCSNEDPNICKECDDGFYSDTNASCLACPTNCLSGTLCDRYNGSCSQGCNEYWSGEQCDIPCPTGCRKCDQFNHLSCSLCKDEFYGVSCKNVCNSGCLTKRQYQTCQKSSGICNLDCKQGYWDNLCDKQCGKGCSGNVCNRSTGNCLSNCLETHFGQMCDNQCNGNCVKSTGRSCNETDGYCLDGCQAGWFGKQCHGECGQNCKKRICDRSNASCTYGCIDGYSGFMCSQALQLDDPNTAAIGGGAGAGVAVLIILVVIVVAVILRRRKTSSKMETMKRQSVEKNHSLNQTEPAGPEYSNINEARIEKQMSELTGVTNLVYTNAPVRMSDISEKDEAISGNAKTKRPTSEDYLKELEIDDDVKVDDDEADTVGVVNDTYYNMGVTVAKLADYIKHKPIEDIVSDFEKIPKGLIKSYKEAKKAKNATKSKYRAIYPYDENRVVLLGGDGDYMNASYIDGYNRPKEYIASSGPFQKSYDTTTDFWRMIWQERCEILVMLTKPIEDGQTKCTKYWPDADESCRYGGISITCLTEDVYADFTIRILTVTKGGESLNIRHVHFTAWPDKGIPHDVTSMIELRQKVRSLHKDKESPIIVHCSAGIGRTGTFIALDMLTYEGEGRGSVDIYGSVASLRYQRCNMVQTPEQYVYLHHAVLHSLTFDCRSIPGDMFLQNYNKLIERNGGERIIDKQFQQLQSIADEMTNEDRVQIEKNKAFSNKNRKGADVPADESRVKLHENRKPGASDYINAVYVNSFRKKKQFICAQTPLPSSVVDFLSLIHQEKCTCVVSMEEPNIQDKTIKVYWPADNQVLKHGVFKVCCKDSQTTAYYVTKKLSITYHGPNGEESRDVNLYIFTNWSKDSLVPKTSDSLLELVKTVDATNRTCEYEAPILIHCGTGANRSCLYCAVSVLIEKMEIEHEVSVVNTLRQIKARRLLAISSVEQYKFCHQAVISYLQSFDIYSNFGLKEADA